MTKAKSFEELKKAMWAGLERELHCSFTPEARTYAEDVLYSGQIEPEELDDFEDSVRQWHHLFQLAPGKALNRQSENETTSSRGRYQKSFERRLHLFAFVERWKHRNPGKRIDWKQLCREWNKEYPFLPMSPSVFNAEYHRIKADKEVLREYLSRQYQEYVPQVQQEAAMSATVHFTRILEGVPPVDKGTEVDFSANYKTKGVNQNERFNSTEE